MGGAQGAGLATSSALTALPFYCPNEGLLSSKDINGSNFFSDSLSLFPLRNIDFSLHSAWDGAE